MTSHDVVAYCRRLLGKVKTGHTGTLDPAAAGVLVLCFGPATRLIDFLKDDTKSYRAEFGLGRTTDTDDQEGQVLSQTSASHLTLDDIEAALPALRGPLRMTSPIYSAQKQDGQPLYRKVRAGQEVTPKVKDVEVFLFEAASFLPGEEATFLSDIDCGKGTYIRSLARMLGEALEVGGYLKGLLRTRVGPFRLEESLTLEEFEALLETGELARALLPPSMLVAHLPVVEIEPETAGVLAHGQPITARQTRSPLPGKFGQLVRVETADGRLIALGRAAATEAGPGIAPIKVMLSQEETER